MTGNIPYIPREQTDQILSNFNEAINNPATNPLVFNVWGIGGVGKTRLLNELQQKHPNTSFARVYFGSTPDIATPLKLMSYLYSELPGIEIGDWGEEEEPFTVLYKKYEETLAELAKADKKERDTQTTERKEAIKKLVAGSTKFVTKIIPLVKDIPGAEDKIGLMAEGGVDLVDWLQKQKVTKKDQELQALMLNPIPKLTEAFINGLITKSQQQAVVLLLDTYEKTNNEIDDWLWQYLIANSQLKSHPIRIVVAGRNDLLTKENWRKLNQDFGSVNSLEIKIFNLEQTQVYLENIGITEKTNQIYQVTRGLPYYLNWIRKQKEIGKELDFSQGNQEIANLLFQGLDRQQQKIIQLAACCRWLDKPLIEELTTNPQLVFTNVADTQVDCFEWLKDLDFVELSQHRYRLDDVARDVFRLSLWQEDSDQFCQVHQVIANYFEQKANREVSVDSSPRLKYENDEWQEYTAEFLYHYLFAKQQDSEQRFLSYLFESCYWQTTEVVTIPFNAITAEGDLESHLLLSSSIINFLKVIQSINNPLYLAFDEQQLIETLNEYAKQYLEELSDEQLEELIKEYKLTEAINQLIAVNKLEDASEQLSLKRNYVIYIWQEFSVNQVKNEIKPALNYCFEKLESLDGLARFAALLYKAKHCPQSQKLKCLEFAKLQAEEIIIESDPQFSSGLFLWDLGNAFLELKQYEELVASYDRAIEINSDNDSAWYNRGIALGNLGKYKEAVTSYDRAIEINPDDYSAWSNRGNALVNLARYEEAVASYDRAIEINPNYDLAWYNRGVALGNLGKYEEAVASYDRAIEINPNYDLAWYNRGVALGNLGKYKEAVASYDRAIEIKPDKDSAWCNHGNALGKLGRYEEAVASYDRAIEINPNDDSAWYNRGLALGNLERYEEAVASYDRAIEINPNDDSAWYNRASCYALQNQIEPSLESLTQAINLNPEYREMAKTDTNFDNIRSDVRFMAIINSDQ
jgi:tetratricopeptide (TPR) repeat protein